MSDSATSARPYARAVFELARDAGTLAAWRERLQALATLAGMADARALFGMPGVARQQLTDVVSEAAGIDDGAGRNFVRLLAVNRRLGLLPAIFDAFEPLRREHEGTAEVTVTTATEVDESQRAKLVEAIERHLSLRADVRWDVDAELLAGARIRAGDQVIDATASSQLDQLRHALTA